MSDVSDGSDWSDVSDVSDRSDVSDSPTGPARYNPTPRRRCMTTWYLLESGAGDGQPSGPHDIEQMAMRASSGRLRPDSMVARVGSADWVAANADPELAGFFRTAPPTEALAPSSTAPPGATLPPGPGGDYAFGTAFELGTTTFRRCWGHLVIVGLVFLAISVVIGVPQGIAEGIGEASGDRDAALALGLFGSCIGFILQVLVGLPLFMGFRRYGTVLLASLVLLAIGTALTVAAYLVALVIATIFGFSGALAGGLVGGGNGAPIVFGAAFLGFAVTLLVAFLLVALVLVRVAFVPAMVADPALGTLSVGEALSRNWQQTRGLGFSLVALSIVTSFLAALSILLLCVGYVLVGLPLLIAVLGAAYELVIRGKAGPPPIAPGVSG